MINSQFSMRVAARLMALLLSAGLVGLGGCGGGGDQPASDGGASVVPEQAGPNQPADPDGANPPSPDPTGKPRVVVVTDINNAGGDPDDKQSLVHLLWYADELDIRGIIPDYWNGDGIGATMAGLSVYEQDYNSFGFAAKGFPTPQTIKSRVATYEDAAIDMIINEADASAQPLYVLIWGDMETLRLALYKRPDIVSKLRVLSIATGRKYGDPNNCNSPNWNAAGRNAIYDDGRFDNMWWVESNWTYNGMFDGDRPRQILVTMSGYGAMGWHMNDVVRGISWAQYFRAGDTPTVLYLLDPDGARNDPTRLSWAGMFTKPFPGKRPNYYTDASAGIDWNYSEPCASWWAMEQMYDFGKGTLGWTRERMYEATISKLNRLYNR